MVQMGARFSAWVESIALGFSAVVFPSQALAEKYTMYTGHIDRHELPWIFDGKQISKGIALRIADANTKANQEACANEWKRSPGHRGLCTGLADLKIVAVRLTDFNSSAVAFVPVSRIAKISAGDDVPIRMGKVASDKAVRSLPEFVRVVSKPEPGAF
jgi:hypothetical protein